MKVLWVKAGKILPLDSGGKIRSFKILQQLAKTDDVALLTFYEGHRDSQYEREVAKHFPEAITMHTPTLGDSWAAMGVRYLWKLASPAPFAVTKFTAKSIQHKISKLLRESRFDVAVCDFLSASLNFPFRLPIPAVLFQHNVESLLWRRLAQCETNLVRRVVFQLEAAKMLRYERAAVVRFDHIIAVSEKDRDEMAPMTDVLRITVVPTGVDCEQFCTAEHPVSEPLVTFPGGMDWEPNIDGAHYFCSEIWPLVLRSVPGARLRIVGRNPVQSVWRLASDSVEVTGTVPSIIKHIHEAAVVVVPLRAGGGTRIKIYEAMACGKAVVSSSLGAEGLDITSGDDIILADDPKSFAEAVVALLLDTQKRRRYEQRAASSARRHDWSAVSIRFRQALEKAVEARSKGKVTKRGAGNSQSSAAPPCDKASYDPSGSYAA